MTSTGAVCTAITDGGRIDRKSVTLVSFRAIHSPDHPVFIRGVGFVSGMWLRSLSRIVSKEIRRAGSGHLGHGLTNHFPSSKWLDRSLDENDSA